MKLHEYTNGQAFALIILRILIGWHLLYEGLVKVLGHGWTAASFLAGSQGPFADLFKAMAVNPTVLVIVDQLNQWGLVLVGLGLILGILNRWACIGGMLLLFLYYISNPPLIGIDPGIAEGNYLIVNKNLVELFALLVLLLFPTEKIVGLRRLLPSDVGLNN